MSTTRYIHNISGIEITYRGVPIADDGFLLIEGANLIWYQTSDEVVEDLAGDYIRMSSDGIVDYSDSPAKNLAFLLGSSPEPTDSDGYTVRRSRAFSASDGYRFRGTGVSNTATKNTTTNIDYKMPEDRMINGVHLFLDGHKWDDYIKFQVVDVDNLLGYGAGVILDEFGSTWNIDPNTCAQRHEIIDYPAKIKKDLYLRTVYVSTGTVDDVKVKINLYLHKVPTS